MTTAEALTAWTPDPPSAGQLARVRGRMWVVGDVLPDSQAALDGRQVQHLVSLVSVEDDATGEELEVVWEIEPGTSVIERAELPAIAADRLDEPAELDAFLDAVRWGAVTSADHRSLQAPFRSGIVIEDYQLEPLVRALRSPRTNLLIADDVGLGKTIEAGLVVQELFLRHRARTALVVCPASLQLQWRDEMWEKFGLEFRIVDREMLGQLRRSRGVGANPFAHFPRLIVSIDWLKGELGMRLLREVLPPHPEIPRRYDVLIVDEVHNCAPAGAGGRYAKDTLRTQAIRTLAPHCEHRLFLSATPHNGYENSFAALLELLDPHRFARGIEPSREATREVTVRRLKQDLLKDDGTPRFPRRKVVMLEVEHPESEREVHALLVAYAAARAKRLGSNPSARAAADFVTTLLKKRLFSSPAAFLRTLEVHRETLLRARRPEAPPTPTVLQRLFDDAAVSLDGEASEDGVGEAEREAIDAAAAAEPNRPTGDELALLRRDDRLGGTDGQPRGRPHAAAARLGTGQRQAERRVHRRAGNRVLGVPGDAALPAGAADRARDRRRARRAARRHDEHGGARADQEPVAGAAGRLPRPGAAGDRRGVGGDLAAAPVSPARARRDPVEPESLGAAQRPDRPPRPAGRRGARAPLRQRRVGDARSAGRSRGISISSRAW